MTFQTGSKYKLRLCEILNRRTLILLNSIQTPEGPQNCHQSKAYSLVLAFYTKLIYLKHISKGFGHVLFYYW